MAHDSLEKLPPSPDTICGPSSEERIGKEKEQEGNVDSRSIHSSLSGHSDQSTVADHDDVENADDVLSRTITPKKPVVKVSRSERRGLFARFAVIAEVVDPHDYKNSTKWFITFVVAIAAAAAPVGSAIILRMCAALPTTWIVSTDSIIQRLLMTWQELSIPMRPPPTCLSPCIC